MKKFSVTILLLAALVLPVALFLLLLPHFHLSVLVAAVIAIAADWALNIAWAYAVHKTASTDSSSDNGNTLSIASYFGWVCPTVLVLLTWLVWHFVA